MGNSVLIAAVVFAVLVSECLATPRAFSDVQSPVADAATSSSKGLGTFSKRHLLTVRTFVPGSLSPGKPTDVKNADSATIAFKRIDRFAGTAGKRHLLTVRTFVPGSMNPDKPKEVKSSDSAINFFKRIALFGK